MERRFNINGLNFFMQGDGFAGNNSDFEQIVENTIDALTSMNSEEVARLHAGSLWISNDEYDGHTNEAVAEELNRIATKAAQPVLKDWHNTENIIISIDAQP